MFSKAAELCKVSWNARKHWPKSRNLRELSETKQDILQTYPVGVLVANEQNTKYLQVSGLKISTFTT